MTVLKKAFEILIEVYKLLKKHKPELLPRIRGHILVSHVLVPMFVISVVAIQAMDIGLVSSPSGSVRRVLLQSELNPKGTLPPVANQATALMVSPLTSDISILWSPQGEPRVLTSLSPEQLAHNPDKVQIESGAIRVTDSPRVADDSVTFLVNGQVAEDFASSGGKYPILDLELDSPLSHSIALGGLLAAIFGFGAAVTTSSIDPHQTDDYSG